ncbi:MAG: Hsp70 family protein [Chthoniobacterales bacterium]|nr:Hsp70 family protein [Chthoniobacterales bacterium]
MNVFFGIDLGTSNCAVAKAQDGGEPTILPITQVLTPHGIGEKDLLPSAVYIPASGEFPEGVPQLPWEKNKKSWLLGTYARERGSLQPDRLILSAKSWLCNPHVNRRDPLLPWQSSTVTEKWSPVQVAQRLIEHISASTQALAPNQSLHSCVLTVPASFDETARNLTLEAARLAGLENVVLLEEPQAAFYAWLEHSGSNWRSQVQSGDLILVADVGGGTTDFSLISVTEQNGNLALERVAVGEHLLLGGDNMDLTLAHSIAERLHQQKTELDPWQISALVQASRNAKEILLQENAPDETKISIPTRSSRLIASTITYKLTKEETHSLLLDGFFPLTKPTDLPLPRRTSGLREAGLPYAPDPAISKHLARFLHRAAANVASSPQLRSLPRMDERLKNSPILLPDAVLFNGGIFNSPLFRSRLLNILSNWAQKPVRELQGARPDHAVAIGAASYARIRATGRGIRIKAGTSRSYYIGMESAELAVPGRPAPLRALCVAPQGMEEGTSASIPKQTFYLFTGETSEFRFFHTENRAGDTPGTLLPNTNDLEETVRLQAEIPPPPGHAPGEEVPVEIESHVTELGNLELSLIHRPTGQRWKLQFGVRLE